MNCAALSEALLESELFGHEKGAFTGATKSKIGKFEQAHQGTLFLDEVGDMPMSIQAKFLRVLEGHPFERVGGTQNINVDVRVVAATNRELEEAVDSSDFRKDLYFRLQILEISVPPLREHASDIPALARFFLERCCERIGRQQLQLQQDAVDLLCEHDWPGNVRELRNVIERTVVLCDGPIIKAENVRLFARTDRLAAGPVEANIPYEPVSLDAIEQRHIASTLEFTKWNKREASRILEINRSTLDRKLSRYGIEPPTGEMDEP